MPTNTAPETDSKDSTMRHRSRSLLVLATLATIFWPAFSRAGDTSAAQQLAHWSAQAGQPGQAARGKLFFQSRHGAEWSCASCHGAVPTSAGKHASTGKPINPLAPAFNPEAFTRSAKVEKWFKRNCKDVLNRECNPTEKADVLAYLVSLKP